MEKELYFTFREDAKSGKIMHGLVTPLPPDNFSIHKGQKNEFKRDKDRG